MPQTQQVPEAGGDDPDAAENDDGGENDNENDNDNDNDDDGGGETGDSAGHRAVKPPGVYCIKELTIDYA